MIRVHQRRKEIRGLKFVYEPPTLRFFTSCFEPLPAHLRLATIRADASFAEPAGLGARG